MGSEANFWSIGASSVLFSFWGLVLYPATDAATVSANQLLARYVAEMSIGLSQGTIAMVVVAVILALWICVVWWQDKRTAVIEMTSADAEAKLQEIESGLPVQDRKE